MDRFRVGETTIEVSWVMEQRVTVGLRLLSQGLSTHRMLLWEKLIHVLCFWVAQFHVGETMNMDSLGMVPSMDTLRRDL
jgi:hypothetical protein